MFKEPVVINAFAPDKSISLPDLSKKVTSASSCLAFPKNTPLNILAETSRNTEFFGIPFSAGFCGKSFIDAGAYSYLKFEYLILALIGWSLKVPTLE